MSPQTFSQDRFQSAAIGRTISRPLSVLMLDGETNISLFVARCLGQVRNIRLHVVSQLGFAPLRFSRHRSRFLKRQPSQRDEDWLDAIHRAAKLVRPDVLLPVEDQAMYFTARHRSRLEEIAKIPSTPSLEALERLNNKDQLAKLLDENCIAGPKTVRLSPVDDIDACLQRITFPALIKPVRGRSGGGIRYCADRETMETHLEKLDLPGQAGVIAQEFIHGSDIDCSVLCHDGEVLAHTIQQGFLPRSRRFAPQVGVEFLKDEPVLNAVKSLVKTMRFSGVAHVDLRRDQRDGVLRVVDVNARYWGSLLGSLLVGVNFPLLACELALGNAIKPPVYEQGRFIDFSGVVKQISRRALGRGGYRFRYGETGLKYVLRDPAAEAVKLWRQFFCP